jgi:cytochrome oxidase Cu insertion factor (SCO1/SenC/PrrC family)
MSDGRPERKNAKRRRPIGIIRSAPSTALVFLLASGSFQFLACARVEARQKEQTTYVCPMHSEVKSARQGKCPKCGMALKAASNKIAASTPAGGAESGGGRVSVEIPDANVLDQDGRRLRFYSDLVKGKTVAINFIFTTCATICPPLTATFRRVQQQLGERVGRDVALISVSVDPATDVPDRLAAFAGKFNRVDGWTFVTGAKPEIDRLLRALGAYVGDKNDHTPMILIGNESAGYWTRTYGLAPAGTIVKAIAEAADKTATVARQQQAAVQPKPPTPAEAAANYFPNNVLLTQENRQVHFFDDLLKGKTVVINFAFTTCTGVCPPMTANLAKVQEYLGDRVGRDINMITISVDPIIDTPEELRKYADKFKAKPGWYFLTGKKENVDQVLRKVGGYVEDKNQHVSILMIGNVETGEWVKVFAMAKPSEIADAALKVAGPAKK